LLATSFLIGCGGSDSGSDNNSGSSSNFTSSSSTAPNSNAASSISSISLSLCAPAGNTVSISGTVQYERVPLSSLFGNGLDYGNIQTLPVRGAVIQALGDGNCVIAESNTSDTGAYTFDVEQNTDVKIRVQAKTMSTGAAIWDFEVKDNTSNNGLYVLDGSLTTSGITNSTRDLTAKTGWGGSSYTSSRSSAPFAILDSVYKSLMTIVAVDSDVNMDDADIFWSVNNSTASGDKSKGEIGTSYYTNDTLYILGDENSDTDEFDEHVVVHEWGHYFEDNLSRSDSIGGSHGGGDLLDMRVALGEGFGNAFSGMVTGDSVYEDSYGFRQSTSFGFDVDKNINTNPGWFSEGSVQSILYDIFDSANDGDDVVSLGFSAIYETMTSSDYKNQASLTSIFSLINTIKTLNSGSTTDIDTLVTAQTSSGVLGIDTIADNYGTGESHQGYTGVYVANTPIYKTIADDGNITEVCSHNTSQEHNGLGVRQFLRLNVASAGNHTITVIYSRGEISSGESSPNSSLYLDSHYFGSTSNKTLTQINIQGQPLLADEYILEIYDYKNIDGDSSTGGSVCFNVTVTGS